MRFFSEFLGFRGIIFRGIFIAWRRKGVRFIIILPYTLLKISFLMIMWKYYRRSVKRGRNEEYKTLKLISEEFLMLYYHAQKRLYIREVLVSISKRETLHCYTIY
jgi:hypothetical protein